MSIAVADMFINASSMVIIDHCAVDGNVSDIAVSVTTSASAVIFTGTHSPTYESIRSESMPGSFTVLSFVNRATPFSSQNSCSK